MNPGGWTKDRWPGENDETHLPAPTLGPVGFALGIVVVLVGLIVNPLWISTIGAAIAVIFGFLWAREASAELRRGHVAPEPELREAGVGDAPAVPANVGEAAMPEPEPGERFPRSKFLEASTLGLGAVIGGVVTVPVAGFAILPRVPRAEAPRGRPRPRHRPRRGPVVHRHLHDGSEGGRDVSRRTAFVRNNGS